MVTHSKHKDTASMLARTVPPWATRVLQVACDGPRFLVTSATGSVNRLAVEAVQDAPPFRDGGLDAIVLPALPPDSSAALALLGEMKRVLAPDGCVLLLVESADHCGVVAGKRAHPGRSIGKVYALLTEAGLVPYRTDEVLDTEPGVAQGEGGGRLTLGDISIPFNTEAEMHSLLVFGHVATAVRQTYNPIEHARRLVATGRPDWACHVLERIPPDCRETDESKAVIGAETQFCLLAMDFALKGQADAARGRLKRFAKALPHFHEATHVYPREAAPYLCQARFWERMGDVDMARRLLATIHDAAPSEETASALEAAPVPRAPRPHPAPPPWDAARFNPRILFILPGRPHYGLDVLYDGLRRVLGADGVVDYPWKGTLHGEAPAEHANYPCVFDHPGGNAPFEELLAQVRAGRFDLILVGSVYEQLGRSDIQELVHARMETPVFLVDEEDDPNDNRARVIGALGLSRLTGCFKREMLACHDYGADTFPLPFAYPDGRVTKEVCWERTEAIFWAGHRISGLRALYLQCAEESFGVRLDRKYAQDEYVKALSQHRIGLNFFGYGFDTVRYWELPAHGCLLFSERLPIHVPLNFQDGVSAVFFEDLPSFKEKLGHYMAHPEECVAIARAGHAHLREHHTGTARARHCLGWIQTKFAAGC